MDRPADGRDCEEGRYGCYCNDENYPMQSFQTTMTRAVVKQLNSEGAFRTRTYILDCF
jgi:hypothetical protein